jgi:hypothetical protein
VETSDWVQGGGEGGALEVAWQPVDVLEMFPAFSGKGGGVVDEGPFSRQTDEKYDPIGAKKTWNDHLIVFICAESINRSSV